MDRSQNKLTAAEVKSATFTDRGKPYKLRDGGGLYLHVTEKGKYWRWRYYWGKNDRGKPRERTLALGVYPDVTLASARDECRKARELHAKGIEPNVHRKATRKAGMDADATTFRVVADEWLYEVHKRRVTDSHFARNRRRLAMHVYPSLARRPIADIAPREVLAVLRKVEGAGSLETAHRLLALCGQVFRYAIATDRAERDATADLRGVLASPSKKHHPAIISPQEIGPLLRAIDGYGGYPPTRAALKLSPLLFVRPGELRKSVWVEFDLDTAKWDYIPSKGGDPLVVPLARQAVEILQEMYEISGADGYVFPSARGRGRPMSENTINAALHRMGYKDVMTGHGFRAMARTVLVEQLGYPAEHVEMQLAHSVRDPLGRA
ncbi:MAG: integrase arm-type DNA-binding domain-containing protein, partial [Candidatus Latescibacterota bacterium]|nr:integrase arm-type DNA-binding domain-containing protein [Candidatus Latescibacterota bacterium]